MYGTKVLGGLVQVATAFNISIMATRAWPEGRHVRLPARPRSPSGPFRNIFVVLLAVAHLDQSGTIRGFFFRKSQCRFRALRAA